MKMKFRLTPLQSLLCLALLLIGLTSLNTGCMTTKAPDGSTVVDTNRVDKLANVLKTAVSDVVILAAEDRKQETRNNILLARNIINGLIASGETTPGSLQDALAPQLRNAKPEVKVAISTAIGLFEVYYGDYVKGKVGGNIYAAKFLTAAVEGIDRGLSLAPPVTQ